MARTAAPTRAVTQLVREPRVWTGNHVRHATIWGADVGRIRWRSSSLARLLDLPYTSSPVTGHVPPRSVMSMVTTRPRALPLVALWSTRDASEKARALAVLTL